MDNQKSKDRNKGVVLLCFFFGISQATLLYVYAIIYKIAIELMLAGHIGMEELYVTLLTILMAVFGAGHASSYLTDVSHT